MDRVKPMPRDRLDALRPLYADFPGLHGALLGAALEGAHGVVSVDDAESPRVARVVIGDFHCVGGDPTAPGAAEPIIEAPSGDYLAVPESWHEFVRMTRADVYPSDRFAVEAPRQWDRAHLARLRESLPRGFRLARIDAHSVKAFEELNETFVANFKSVEDYLARGVGFGITEENTGRMVAGCSSYTIGSKCLEFEIETGREFQRRGFALVAGARMIEHCLDNGLEPYWDAAHEGSAVLAEKLGFVNRRRYTAYRVGIPPYRPPDA